MRASAFAFCVTLGCNNLRATVLKLHLHSISGPMTGALVVYAATFMRYSLAITPKNYLLFACHLTNFGAQTTQGFRYLNYWKYVSSRQGLFWSCLSTSII